MRALALSFLTLLTATLHAQQWNWAVSAGDGSNVDQCYGIATDSQGNVYWAGSVRGTSQFGCGTITTGSNTAGVLAKYDATGNCLWVRSVLVTFDDALAYDIAIDAEDRIYITGSYNGMAVFSDDISLDSYVGDDIFVARYDVDGTCLWARRAGSSSNDEARGIAVSADGDVFITGYVGGFTVRFDPLEISSNNQRQVFVASYDSTGTLNWAKLSTGIGQSKSARGISVAGDRLFITGQIGFSDASFDGIPILPTTNTIGAYVLACDLSGNALWAGSYIGGDNEGMGITADTLGNVFMVGRLWGSMFLPDDTLTSVSSNDDFVILKFDADGNYYWGKSTGAAQRDLSWRAAADGMGNVYVAVQFLNTVDFFGTSLTSIGGEDIAIMKMDGEGDGVWVQRAGGFQRDVPLCIHRQAVAPHQLYFGGYYWGLVTYGSTTIDDVSNGDAMMVSATDTTFDVSSIATDVCLGACDGAIEPFVTGATAPFTFQWNNGSTQPEQDGLCPGIYIIEVTDANGQVIIDTVYIEEHTDPGYTVQVLNDSLWTNGGTAWQWFLDGATLVSDSASAIAEETGGYHALVTDAFGCVWSTDTVTVVLNVGVNEFIPRGLRIRPNPAADHAMIEGNGGSPAQARLFNSAGQCLSTRLLFPGTNVLDLIGLDAGVYMLRTEDGRVARLVKE